MPSVVCVPFVCTFTFVVFVLFVKLPKPSGPVPPLNVAVILWVPADSVRVVNVATPNTFKFTMPSDCVPSKNWTGPVGTTLICLNGVAVTVAVMVNGSPVFVLVTFVLTAVVVLAGAMKTSSGVLSLGA